MLAGVVWKSRDWVSGRRVERAAERAIEEIGRKKRVDDIENKKGFRQRLVRGIEESYTKMMGGVSVSACNLAHSMDWQPLSLGWWGISELAVVDLSTGPMTRPEAMFSMCMFPSHACLTRHALP